MVNGKVWVDLHWLEGLAAYTKFAREELSSKPSKELPLVWALIGYAESTEILIKNHQLGKQ